MFYCEDYEDGYYDDDYISPLEAFEGDEDLYNEWLLNSWTIYPLVCVPYVSRKPQVFSDKDIDTIFDGEPDAY